MTPVLRAEQVVEIQTAVRNVIVEEKLLKYIVDIVAAARSWGSITYGPSPRAGVNLLLAARTLAACHGRDFVSPDDIKQLAPWVLRHRLRLRPEAEIEGTTADETIQQIMDSVEAPTIMIPTRRLIVLVALLSVPLWIGSLQRDVADVALVANLILIVVASVDLFISPGPHQLEISRHVSDVLSVGTDNPVSLSLRNKSSREISLTVHDDHGNLCRIDSMPQSLSLEPWKEESIHYAVKPLRRGPRSFLRFTCGTQPGWVYGRGIAYEAC